MMEMMRDRMGPAGPPPMMSHMPPPGVMSHMPPPGIMSHMPPMPHDEDDE